MYKVLLEYYFINREISAIEIAVVISKLVFNSVFYEIKI